VVGLWSAYHDPRNRRGLKISEERLVKALSLVENQCSKERSVTGPYSALTKGAKDAKIGQDISGM